MGIWIADNLHIIQMPGKWWEPGIQYQTNKILIVFVIQMSVIQIPTVATIF